MSRLLTRPVAWDVRQPAERLGHSDRRSESRLAVSKLADQYLMRRVTWASSSSPSPPAKGHGSPSVVYRAVWWDQPRSAFSMQTVRAVLSRARALRAITRSAPARPRTRRAPRNQPMASAKEARNHGADGSRCYGQPRSYPTGWKTVHRLISFGSAAV